MARDLYERISQALDLIGTPLALEVLDDLVHGRWPYSRTDDTATMIAAINCLGSVGAIRRTRQLIPTGVPLVELTPRGHDLFWRLVEIEKLAGQLDAPKAGGSGSDLTAD